MATLTVPTLVLVSGWQHEPADQGAVAYYATVMRALAAGWLVTDPNTLWFLFTDPAWAAEEADRLDGTQEPHTPEKIPRQIRARCAAAPSVLIAENALDEQTPPDRVYYPEGSSYARVATLLNAFISIPVPGVQMVQPTVMPYFFQYSFMPPPMPSHAFAGPVGASLVAHAASTRPVSAQQQIDPSSQTQVGSLPAAWKPASDDPSSPQREPPKCLTSAQVTICKSPEVAQHGQLASTAQAMDGLEKLATSPQDASKSAFEAATESPSHDGPTDSIEQPAEAKVVDHKSNPKWSRAGFETVAPPPVLAAANAATAAGTDANTATASGDAAATMGGDVATVIDTDAAPAVADAVTAIVDAATAIDANAATAIDANAATASDADAATASNADAATAIDADAPAPANATAALKDAAADADAVAADNDLSGQPLEDDKANISTPVAANGDQSPGNGASGSGRGEGKGSTSHASSLPGPTANQSGAGRSRGASRWQPRIHPTQAHLPLSHLSRAAAAARPDVPKHVQQQPVQYGSPIGLDLSKRFFGKIWEEHDPFISGTTLNRYRFYGVKGTQDDGWLDKDSAALLIGNMFDYEARMPITIATLRPSGQGGVDLEVVFRSSETHARFNAVKGPVMRVLGRWGTYPFVPPTTRSAVGQSFTPRMPSAQDQDRAIRFLGGMGTGSGMPGPVSDLRRDETQDGRRLWHEQTLGSPCYDTPLPGADHTRSRPFVGDADMQHRRETSPYGERRNRPLHHYEDRFGYRLGEHVRDRDRDQDRECAQDRNRDRAPRHDDDLDRDRERRRFSERAQDRDRDRAPRHDDEIDRERKRRRFSDRDRPLRHDDDLDRERERRRFSDRDRPPRHDDDLDRDRERERRASRRHDDHSDELARDRSRAQDRDNAGDRSARSDYRGSHRTRSLSPLRKDLPARPTWDN